MRRADRRQGRGRGGRRAPCRPRSTTSCRQYPGARAEAVRQRPAAAVRQRLRQRRGHPLPRRPGHAPSRTATSVAHHPRRGRGLTMADDDRRRRGARRGGGLPADPGGARRPPAAAGGAARRRLPRRLGRGGASTRRPPSEALEYLATYLQRLDGPDLRRVPRGHGHAWPAFAKHEKWPKQQVRFLQDVPDRTLRRRRADAKPRAASHHDLRHQSARTLQPPDALPRHRRGRAAEAARPAASRSAAAAPSAPCWPTPWSAPASASSASSTATSSRRSNLQRQVLFDEHDVAEQPAQGRGRRAQAAADQLGGHGRAGRRRHRPHQHRGLVPATPT